MNNKLLIKVLIITLSGLSLNACHRNDAAKTKAVPYVLTVKPQVTYTRLPYVGTLMPIQSHSIFSPVTGRVVKRFFNYGSYVHKGQKIVLLDSAALETSFRQAVQGFLAKKSSYDQTKADYEGSVALERAKVISQQTFLSAKGSYSSSVLAYYQAKYQLEKILRQVGIKKAVNIESIKPSDIPKITQVLQQHFSNVLIKSKYNGIALLPAGSQGSSASNKKIVVGSALKQSQLIVSIGDLHGIRAVVNVSEININKVKPGLKVDVTGDAFQSIVLHGHVQEVAYQAKPNENGSSALSQFSVSVVIPTLTAAQRKIVHVGMTSKIVIIIKNKPQILIPIQAVTQKGGQSVVTVVSAAGKKQVPVTTGSTTLTKVTIISGLKRGDRVWVPSGGPSAQQMAVQAATKKKATKKDASKK